ncbi:MAG TPA: ROK family protein [Terriglobales bacterium]|nr:ROK family protein [Terriglobales bacterium]
MKTLVIDIGGTNIKIYATGRKEAVKTPSGPTLTPKQMVKVVREATAEWTYSVVSIGYPGPVVHGKPLRDPANLGSGWVGFDFKKAFGCPVRIINDAAMQALGSYRGGRMLFLGLGTGLGSAFVVDGVLEPMELAHLPYKHGRSFEEYVGVAALKRMGEKKWIKTVYDVVAQLKNALQADYVVLGGGNAKRLTVLPPGTFAGENSNASQGGFRLWHTETQLKKLAAAGD